MNITDELRVFAKRWPGTDYIHKDMLAIADRIDAEHEAACAKAYNDGAMSVPIALDKSQWVELPKDANGMPVHIGDVMRLGSVERDITVLGFGVPDVSGHDYGVFVDYCDDYTWFNASRLHHYHVPTVEDVLREFGEWYAHIEGKYNKNGIITEYAAKLRLVKEE